MSCSFVKKLSELKKSSLESIEDATSTNFADFKRYLHIERETERALRTILTSCSARSKKSLILVCGSAGDGKSHLLSYLNNSPEKPLADYTIHNDATESFTPDKTSVETLNDLLDGFSDEKLFSEGKSVVLAINLGTLSNFISSDFGHRYVELKKFVEENQILHSDKLGDTGYIEDSSFQYVSFSDFNNYTLTESGVKTTFIENLFEKITGHNQENVFYEDYCKQSNCSLCSKCPVRHNFEFLSDLTVLKNIAQLLAELSVKNKRFVSTRELLDFVYTIIVPHDFEKKKLLKIENSSEYLSTYLAYCTPNLLYKGAEVSDVLSELLKFDVLSVRSERLDGESISFKAAANIEKTCADVLTGTPYAKIVLSNDINAYAQYANERNQMKVKIFSFITRLQFLCNGTASHEDVAYTEFLRYLYAYNSGKISLMQPLYEIVQKSIFMWSGQLDEKHPRINHDSKIAVYEELSIECAPIEQKQRFEEELLRFSPTITVRFQKENDPSMSKCLSIDYSLYKLISDMANGYQPSASDKQYHADFVAFINSIHTLGNYKREIQLVNTVENTNRKGVFKKTPFGYEFKVI